MPLAEAKSWLSRKKKNRKRVLFFPFLEGRSWLSQKHNRASRERKKTENAFFSFSKGTAVTLAKAQPCLLQKKNHDFRERKKKENVFFSCKNFFPNFFNQKAKEDRGKTKTSKKPRKNRLKSRKRVWKNKTIKSEGSVQSATRGEWLRAHQVALIVGRLPKERSLTSCSRRNDNKTNRA